MLSKEICCRCQKYARESIIRLAPNFLGREKLDARMQEVLQAFDSTWFDEKQTWCPALFAAQIKARALDDAETMFAKTDGEPPECCRYLLEQLMVNQESAL